MKKFLQALGLVSLLQLGDREFYSRADPARYEITSLDPSVPETIRNIKSLPYEMRRVVAKYGAKYVITDRMPKDHRDMELLSVVFMQLCDGIEIDHNPGIYSGKEIIIVPKRSPELEKIEAFSGRLEFHESGHAVDAAYGDLSWKEPFLGIFNEYKPALLAPRMSNNMSMMPNMFAAACNNLWPTEGFARFFADYYYSPQSRSALNRDFPKAADYFRRFENRVAGKR